MACMSTCCCCFTTYQGSIIIGVLTLLPNIAGIGILSHLLNVWTAVESDVHTWALNVTGSLQQSSVQIAGVSDFVNSAATDMHTVCVVLLIYCVITSASCLMVITGTHQASRCMLLPWLTVTLLRLVACIVGVIMYLYIVCNIDDGVVVNQLLGFGIIEVPEIVFSSYFWLCVFSHYHHLQQLEEQVYPMGEEEPVEVLPPVDSDEKF
ncbi:uncharacterized protein LOC119109061 [Pollicipes pollicipes]|uniref:uncharacterized protein LOC119109061 n=1 Tax=Pollicipes pollicipes TaxID=41117 RepID=UPI0018859CE0|nr:uncharacterized protein LOC119109061 [Pollicipes pollicipes]